jgi:polyhydroxybutyrate depolymerase
MQGRIERVTCGLAVVLLTASLPAVPQEDVYVYAGRGPVQVHVPATYDDSPMPLLVALHGRGSTGDALERYVQFTAMSESRGFLLALPDGLRDRWGLTYWNATDVCCGPPTDDSGYLRDLIMVIRREFTVDDRRIFVFGHSNGAVMAHRMGCDHADLLAAIASFSGTTWDDPANCAISGPVHALEIHGTADTYFDYGGGCTGEDACYPSAPDTAQIWAQLNHCTDLEITRVHLDLTDTIPGPDAMTSIFSGCDPGGSSALWTVLDGPHHPDLSPSFNDTVIQYLFSHPKPSSIPCVEVAGMRAQCDQAWTLAINLRLTDGTHDGETVDLEVDDDMYVAVVVDSSAHLTLTGQSQGSHIVRLVEPSGCAADTEVECGL